jgi:hypothetical protein
VAALGVPAAAAPTAPAWVQADAEERSEVLVSITAPTQVERGEWAAFGVTVRELGTSAPVGGTLVVLLRRAAGEGGWAEAARTITDAQGRAVLTAEVKPPATDFRARVPGGDDHRRGKSARVTVTVD